MSKYDVAVVGATGVVGEALLEVLTERQFPIGKLYPLASEKSVGKKVIYNGQEHTIRAAQNFDFSLADITFFSAGSAVAKQLAPVAVAAGSFVVDNSSAFRFDDEIPLVVPEVNPEAMIAHGRADLVANPNCATIPLCIALKPLLDHYGVESAHVVTLQSVSGSGRCGIEQLAKETIAVLNTQGEVEAEDGPYRDQIAFNVVPFIDEMQDNGFTREEMKLYWETKKILGCHSLSVNSTTVRVPVFYGHSEAVTVKLKADFEMDAVHQLLKGSPGIVMVDEQQEALTPVRYGVNSDAVYVSRLRRDLSDDKRGLNFWLVCDNIRKGAALNAVQIAECMLTYSEKILN